jgi:hypothetical protein
MPLATTLSGFMRAMYELGDYLKNGGLDDHELPRVTLTFPSPRAKALFVSTIKADVDESVRYWVRENFGPYLAFDKFELCGFKIDTPIERGRAQILREDDIERYLSHRHTRGEAAAEVRGAIALLRSHGLLERI